MNRAKISKLLFILAFVLVAADVKLNAFGIPTALLCLFLSYGISWEIAHLIRIRWNASTSDAFSTSISLIIVGAFFYFGCTDKAVAAFIQAKGQNAAYGSTQWKLNELTLSALSIGMVMGTLVAAATVVSYAVDAWHQRKPSLIFAGTASSILAGTVVGIPFGLTTMMSATKTDASLLLALIVGLGVATSLLPEPSCRQPNMVSKRQSVILQELACSTCGAMLAGMFAGALTRNILSAVEAFWLVICGSVVGHRLMHSLSVDKAATSQDAPKFIAFGVGLYARNFLALGVCASIALLLKFI